ncbi:superinfection immunity protein [Bradyrhizobium septentrionale]|uniref:superinfection immunity protein n=1 Tax=Bradyrhizobium septentrionale TaxID=1404411 RepID=UPI001596A571|nr:superinfection immunity protein [Bradyrhizobium septentrionale]UGY24963.1 superinfection immunity protein [Bradyrhizobium septentrionale]
MSKRAFIPALIACTFFAIIAAETIALASGLQFGHFAFWIIGFAISAFLYLLPSYVAWRRDHHALLAIFIANLFLGWSFIGWVASLIWSCTPVKPPRQLSLMERALIERNIADHLYL